MKEQVDRHACWFDYFSADPGCSPFIAVTRVLEDAQQDGYVTFYREGTTPILTKKGSETLG